MAISGSDKSQLYAMSGVARCGATRCDDHSALAFVTVDGVLRNSNADGKILRKDDIKISEQASQGANTATLTGFKFTPLEGQEIVITLGSINNGDPIFAGRMSRRQTTQEMKDSLVFTALNAVDYTFDANMRLVTKRYAAMSASSIAIDILTNFAPQLSPAGIVASLPTIDEVVFVNETVTGALSQLAQLIGGYFTISYRKSAGKPIVRLFLTPTGTNPTDLTEDSPTMTNWKYSADISQIATRVRVTGKGSQAVTDTAAGSTTLTLDDVSMFDPSGGFADTADGQRLTYTAAATLAAPSAPSGAVRTGGLRAVSSITRVGATATVTTSSSHDYSTGDVVTIAGAGQTEYNGTFTIVVTGSTTFTMTVAGTPSSPATGTITAFVDVAGAVEVGTYHYKDTLVSDDGETLASSASSTVTVSAVSAAGSLTAAQTSPVVSGNLSAATYAYKVAFGTSAGATVASGGGSGTISTVTAPNPTWSATPTTGGSLTPSKTYYYYVAFSTATGEVSSYQNFVSVSLGGSDNAVSLTSIPTSGDARVTARRIYRNKDAAQPYVAFLVTTINDNSTTSLTDTVADASLTVPMPLTNTASDGQMVLTGIPTSSDQRVIRRILFRSKNGSTYRQCAVIDDNVTTTLTDNVAESSLGTEAPTVDRSGGAQVRVGSVATSADPRVTRRNVYRSMNGGTVYHLLATIPDPTTTYYVDNTADANLSATLEPVKPTIGGLTGIPSSGDGSITTDIAKGTTVSLVVILNDTGAQTALAALMGTGDGIREVPLTNSNWSITEATSQGTALLELRSAAQVTATYTTRDKNTRVGQSISFDVNGVTGTLKIQSVQIHTFSVAGSRSSDPLGMDLFPTYDVTASNQRYSLEDLLRQLKAKAT